MHCRLSVAITAVLVTGCALGPGEPPDLVDAVGRGNAQEVAKLLDEGADANTEHEGLLPLNDAAITGHVEVLHVLLRNGADPNGTGDSGLSPLASAAIGGRVDAAEALLLAGADVCTTVQAEGVKGRPSAFVTLRDDLPVERREAVLRILHPAEARC